jgi:hypothetical protein
LLSDFIGAPVQSEVASVHSDVPGSEYQRPGGQHSRTEFMQLSPHGFPGRLKLQCPLRALKQPDVMRGDQVSERPDERYSEPSNPEQTQY